MIHSRPHYHERDVLSPVAGLRPKLQVFPTGCVLPLVSLFYVVLKSRFRERAARIPFPWDHTQWTRETGVFVDM